MRLRARGSVRYVRTMLVAALFVLAVGFMAPTTAWASEGEEGTTGFLAGLDTLVNPDSVREVENDPVRDYEYEPELREIEIVELDEVATPIQGITSVINKANSVQNGNTSFVSLQVMARWFLQNQVVPIAVLFVFMWWGVRKAKNMIVAAWRGGKASV